LLLPNHRCGRTDVTVVSSLVGMRPAARAEVLTEEPARTHRETTGASGPVGTARPTRARTGHGRSVRCAGGGLLGGAADVAPHAPAVALGVPHREAHAAGVVVRLLGAADHLDPCGDAPLPRGLGIPGDDVEAAVAPRLG